MREGAVGGAGPYCVSGGHAGKEGIPSLRGGTGALLRRSFQQHARRRCLGQPRHAPRLPRGAVPARQNWWTGCRRARNPPPADARSAARRGPLAKNATAWMAAAAASRHPSNAALDPGCCCGRTARRRKMRRDRRQCPHCAPPAALLPLRAQRADHTRQPARNSEPVLDHVHDRAGLPPAAQDERGKDPHVV